MADICPLFPVNTFADWPSTPAAGRSQGVGQLIMAVGQSPIGIKAVRHLSTNADINFSQPRGLPDFSPCACYCVCVKRESGHNMSVHPDISM